MCDDLLDIINHEKQQHQSAMIPPHFDHDLKWSLAKEEGGEERGTSDRNIQQQ